MQNASDILIYTRIIVKGTDVQNDPFFACQTSLITINVHGHLSFTSTTPYTYTYTYTYIHIHIHISQSNAYCIYTFFKFYSFTCIYYITYLMYSTNIYNLYFSIIYYLMRSRIIILISLALIVSMNIY